jgi:hypothetical protein
VPDALVAAQDGSSRHGYADPERSAELARLTVHGVPGAAGGALAGGAGLVQAIPVVVLACADQTVRVLPARRPFAAGDQQVSYLRADFGTPPVRFSQPNEPGRRPVKAGMSATAMSR